MLPSFPEKNTFPTNCYIQILLTELVSPLKKRQESENAIKKRFFWTSEFKKYLKALAL